MFQPRLYLLYFKKGDDIILKRYEFFSQDSIDFDLNWLKLEDYELKILTLISLSDQLEYSGTLKNIREWLGVSNQANNNTKIKTAINNLVEKEYIYLEKEKTTYHFSLGKIGLDIVKIRKVWIETIINNKADTKWTNVLKVFALSYNEPFRIWTHKMMSDCLNLSEHTISRAIAAIVLCNFEGIEAKKEIIRERDYYGNWKVKGTNIDYKIVFKDKEL